MPKALLLTATDPTHPTQGDQWRVRGLWQALQAVAEVTLLQWGGPYQGSHPYVPYPKTRMMARMVAGLTGGPPLSTAAYRTGWPGVPPGPWDIVVGYQLKTARWALSVQAPVAVLDLTDSLGYYRRHLGVQADWLTRLRLWGVEAEEVRWAKRFRECWVAAEPDRDWLKARDVPVRVVPNGVPEVRPLPYADPRHLLFVGNLAYWPNRVGLSDFLSNVWPRLRSAGYRLSAVGRGTDQITAAGVDGHGLVDNVRRYYEQAGVVISPVGRGAGSPTKVLEGLAYGRPVVANALGIAGLTEAQRSAVLAVSNPSEWLRLLNWLIEPDQWEKWAQRGPLVVEIWGNAFGRRLRELLDGDDSTGNA